MSTEAKKAAAEEAITKEALTRYQATTAATSRLPALIYYL